MFNSLPRSAQRALAKKIYLTGVFGRYSVRNETDRAFTCEVSSAIAGHAIVRALRELAAASR